MSQELPEHVAESGEWQDWPRKLDIPSRWGVRTRQVEAFARNGKLKVYACPDGTRRVPIEQCRELFGEPGVVQGRERDMSATERRVRQAEAATATDPVALMFGRVVGMIDGLHAQLIGQLRVVSDPMRVLLDAQKDLIKAQQERIAALEKQADEAAVLRSELADAKQERDLALRRHEASERRRDETLALLKEQVPVLAKVWLEGNTLSEFARRTPKPVIEAIVDAGELSEQDAEVLRRAAGIGPKPAPSPATGVS